MDLKPNTALDYTTPTTDRRRRDPVLLGLAILFLIVGGLFFFTGMGAIGLDIKAGEFERRSIVTAAVGVAIYGIGTGLKHLARRD